MKDDTNVKTLSYVFIIVFIIIFLIILIFLIKYVFSANSHGYKLSTEQTTTINKSYKKLDDGSKLEYNNLLYDNTFLISLNNSINNNYSYKEVDLLQSEESKFKYIYTYLKLTDKKETINYNDINSKCQELFNTTISKENIVKYLKDDIYIYNVNYANPNYCFKATRVKKSNNKYSIMVDLVDYNSEVCNPKYLDYDESKVFAKAIIDATKSNNKYYFISFMITN